MPEPKTAEEWALTADGYVFCVPCREEHERKRPAAVDPTSYFCYKSCPDCRRAHITHCLNAYARQRVEAWREKACEAVCTLCDEGCPIEYDERGAYHKWQERDQDGDPVDVTDGCDAEALRTLPVEMP